jgi:hypothetical protein
MEAKNCELCGKSFAPKYSVTKKYWAKRRFCSDECKNKGVIPPPRTGTGRPIEIRFWEKVKRAAPSECWLWIGSLNADGYGMLAGGQDRPDVNLLRAHRVSWEINRGQLSADQHVLHHCDNPQCVNPKHLFLGDQVSNNADRDRKGRGGDRSGERNGRTVVTDQQVAEIRAEYAKGGISQLALGAKYEISEVQVWRIVNRYQRT